MYLLLHCDLKYKTIACLWYDIMRYVLGQRAVCRSASAWLAQARMLHLPAEADRVAHLKGSSQVLMTDVDHTAYL